MNQTKFMVTLAESSWSKILMIAGLIVGLYYLAAYDDGSALRGRYQNALQQLDESNRKLVETKEALKEANDFEEKVKSQERQFQKVTEFMPADLTGAELNRIITKQAVAAGARIMKIDPIGADTKIEFYEMTKVRVSLQGSFAQIMAFLSNMTKVQKLITIDDLELGVLTGTDPEMPRLTCGATLIGYRYVAEPTPEKGTQAGGAVNAPK